MDCSVPKTVFALVAQPLVAEGLARVLGPCADLDFVGYCGAPDETIARVGDLRPSLLVLDHAFGLRVLSEMMRTVRDRPPAPLAFLWTKASPAPDARMLRNSGLQGVIDQAYEADRIVDCLRSAGLGSADEPMRAEAAALGASAARLTQREWEILTLIKSGLKNREIAERMKISPGTVKVHLKHIFEKTGARDRVELGERLSPAPEVA